MKLRLTLAAEADLSHVRETISSENPVAAERVRQSISRAIELLKFFPYLGRAGSVKGTREKAVKSLPYIIVYAVNDDELVVLRIYHGAQDRP
ncbi:MAG: type II toxin-antitoxin system RelE/ParE family toxin [Rhodomicrobium sp.]